MLTGTSKLPDISINQTYRDRFIPSPVFGVFVFGFSGGVFGVSGGVFGVLTLVTT